MKIHINASFDIKVKKGFNLPESELSFLRNTLGETIDNTEIWIESKTDEETLFPTNVKVKITKET